MATDLKRRVVRPKMTDRQWRALRVLAAERDETIGDLVTWALHTSPHTRNVMRAPTKETKA